MARTSDFNDKFNIVAALQAIAAGMTGDEAPSRFHREQLVEKGFLVKEKKPELKKVVGSRGRAPVVYNLTGRGKGYINLSKNWKRPEGAKAPQIVEINVAPQPETVTA